MRMDDVESQVQKHIVNFCKILPAHVNNWKSVIQESTKPLQTLWNLCEQQRHVKKAKLSYMDDFDGAQAMLLYQISTRIEEELIHLKGLIDMLCKSGNDIKNKLLTLERSTLNLDWEKDSLLIRGNGSQPSLTRLLQDGLDFSTFFSKRAKNISDHLKTLNVNEERSIRDLQASFNVDLNDKAVSNLIALTQYVDNEKAIL